MLKKIITLIALSVFIVQFTYAQMVVIGAGSLTGPSSNSPNEDSGPMYRSSAASAFVFSRHHYLYTQSELAASGIFPGTFINSVAWNKDNSGATNSPAIFEIWMKNSTLTNVQTPPQSWATLTSGSTLVYNLPTTVSSAIGFVDFNLSTSFFYTGGALEISTNFDISSGTNPWTTDAFSWRRDIAPNRTISYVLNVAGTTLNNARNVRPQIRFGVRSTRGNDASISQLVSSSKFCGNTQNLIVKVANLGVNPINNVLINWSIDGVLQTPLSLITLLDTLDHPTNKSDTNITLGTISYTPNVSRIINVWTSMPNGLIDTTTINDSLRVRLQPGLSGTYSIGGIGAGFASFNAAISRIDTFGKCGPLIFNVTAGMSFTQQPLTLTNLDSITFQKFGIGPNPKVFGVRGVSNFIDAIFRIAGCRNITFNGIDVSDSTSNFTTTTSMDYGYSIVNSTSTRGSSNIIIRNCKITLNRAGFTCGLSQSTIGTSGGVSPTNLSGSNHNNRYENIKVENSLNGIEILGSSVFPDSNNIITSVGLDSTIIGSNTPNDIGNFTNLISGNPINGILVKNQRNIEISKCVVRNVTQKLATNINGIFINNDSTNIPFGKAHVWGNTVYNINRVNNTTNVGTVTGINIDFGKKDDSAKVWNNIVYSINLSDGSGVVKTNNQLVRGISHGTSIGTSDGEYYHNSVSLNYSNTSSNTSSASFWKGGTGNVIVRNNIFQNYGPSKSGLPKSYGSYISNTIGSFISSNNLYWIPDANGFIGFASGDRATLPLFAAATSLAAPSDGNEQGSANADANFILPNSDLRFASATPASNSGTPIVSSINITTDILGNPRNPTTPSIGAIETTQPLLDSAAPVISNVIIINSNPLIVRATIRENSNASVAGNVRLWYRAGSSGAFTSVAPDSIPTGTMNGVYRWSTSFNSLPLGVYQFYIVARDTRGAGLNIAANPIQSTSFTGFSNVDPVNFVTNPNIGVNVRTFVKTFSLVGGSIPVPVGATSAPYFKLTDVANRLNFAELTGNVVFELQPDYDGTTGETFPIVFNPLITSGGNWSVTIRPALGVTGRETSGYPSSSLPIIELNGIDRLILDGRPGGVGTASEWTIRSKRTSTSNTSPSIQFDNGSQRNLITNLKIESDNTATTSGAIFISNTAFTEGNSFNQILNCSIRNRSDSIGNLALGIYAAGTTEFTNDSNIISTNAIFNWTNSGVQVTSTGNGSNWRIVNNHFYMIAPRTTPQTAIHFGGGIGANGIRINGNFIGGSAPSAGGTAWTNSVAGDWKGIICSSSPTDSVQIQNNTIQNLNLTGATGTFAGIEMTGALASIRNNTIGHPSTPNNIQSYRAGITTSIYLNNANNQALIDGNLIANINSISNTAIFIASANTSVPLIIKNNSIYSLNVANPISASSTSPLTGILSNYAGTQQIIERNTIFGLKNNAIAGSTVFGINVSNAAGAGTINANNIYNLNNFSVAATAQIVGIHLNLGDNWNVTNNMIALGTGNDSSAIISGIQDKTNGINHNISFNSVLISGNANSLTATLSHAFRRMTPSTINVRNNIFQNIRTGGTGNYAIANTSTTPSIGWRANFNVLNSANSSQLGLWNTTPTNFAGWKTVSSHDTASINNAASFVSLTDLHLTAPTVGNVIFGGRPIAGITTDFDGQTRHPNFPYIGADENTAFPLPIDLVYFTAKRSNTDAVLQWQTASETNNSHFTIERSLDANEFTAIGKIKGKGNTQVLSAYLFTDKNIGSTNPFVYYRLRQVDFDGTTDITNVVSVDFSSSKENELSIAPNPFDNYVQLSFESKTTGATTIEIMEITGKVVATLNQIVSEGYNNIRVDNLSLIPQGIYMVRLKINETVLTYKIVKY